jgi:hypothetical protein
MRSRPALTHSFQTLIMIAVRSKNNGDKIATHPVVVEVDCGQTGDKRQHRCVGPRIGEKIND